MSAANAQTRKLAEVLRKVLDLPWPADVDDDKHMRRLLSLRVSRVLGDLDSLLGGKDVATVLDLLAGIEAEEPVTYAVQVAEPAEVA